MKVFGKITCILLFSVTSFCFFLVHPFISHADHTPRQVLFISSYSESFVTVPQQIQGMKEVFEGTDVVLQYEYLDAKRLSSEENVQYFYEYLSYKLSTLPPYEAILVADDAALQFVMDYQAELFDQIPIVFFAINDKERATNADALPNTAGSIEETSLEDNISLALSINPTATKVVGIADNTVSGLGDQKQFYKAAESFPELDFSILNASDLTYEEIWSRLEKISPDTILLYLCLNEDSSKVFIDFDTATEKIAEHASVPVYRATVGGIGMGIFGGHLISYEEMGRYSAELVLSILEGNDIDAIPLKTDTPYYSAFDYPLIEKYNIDIDLLPEDAIFYNKPESPFDQYRKYFVYLAIVLVFSITISVIMVIDSMKSRMLRKKLQVKNDELGSLYEELTASEEELREQYEVIQKHAFQLDYLHQKYEIAITATNCVVWEMDLDKDEVTLSPNILELTGVPFPEKVSRKLFCQTLFPEQYQRSILNEVEYYISGKVTEINLQVPLLPFRNENKWLLVRGKGLKIPPEKLIVFLVS
jgi:PAS domain-containing protein